jgi:DNA-binding protein HU-beta
MNKTELVEAVAKDSGLTNADARKAVESFISTVEKSLKKGDEIALTGFGKFSVVKRSARTGRNPQTGEAVKIKASKAPKVTAGAGLKTAVNGARKKERPGRPREFPARAPQVAGLSFVGDPRKPVQRTPIVGTLGGLSNGQETGT